MHVSTLLSTKGEGDFQKGEGPAIPPALPKLKIYWKKTIRKKRIKQWEKIVGKRYHFMTATGWLLPYFIQRRKQSCDTFTFPRRPMGRQMAQPTSPTVSPFPYFAQRKKLPHDASFFQTSRWMPNVQRTNRGPTNATFFSEALLWS